LLGERRKAENRIDLFLAQQPNRLPEGHGHPGDVLRGVDTDVGKDDAEEQVLGEPELPHGNGFMLEIPDSTDATAREQFEAPEVLARENHALSAFVELYDEVREEQKVEVGLA
jgi:hypothetical protein